ncbi:hypothetical protein JW978_03070 [Candidatus Dojkabacteria bacterium]|nr:hypothetical protein [Candidatus Dojkabacteria bacterium]
MSKLRKPLANYLGLFLLLSTIIIFGASKLFTLEEFIPLRGEEFFKLFSPSIYAIYIFLFYTSIEAPRKKKIWANIVLVVSIAIMGQGIAMNQTANYFNLQYHDQVTTEAYDAIYFYDEYLGHFLALMGMLTALGLILYFALDSKTKQYKPVLFTYFSGILTGTLFFVQVIESQMVPAFMPLAAVLMSLLIYNTRKSKTNIFKNDLLTLFFFAFSISMTLILIWGAYHGSFLEFSDLGWI